MTHIQTKTIIDLFLSTTPGMRSTSTAACVAVIAEMGQATVYDVTARLGTTRESATRTLASLVEAGFLTVEKGSAGIHGKKRNIYRIKA
jgi:predicted transcriptional regulator